jgi:hypothetical protein
MWCLPQMQKTSGIKSGCRLISVCFHNPTHQNVSGYQFFILSKGNNAGKPGLGPWANSFIAIAPMQK